MAAVQLVIEEQCTPPRTHVLGAGDLMRIAAYDVLCGSDGNLHFEPSTDVEESSRIKLALLQISFPVIRLQCLTSDISVNAADLGSIPVTAAAQQLCQLQPPTFVFLRPGDTVQFQLRQLGFPISFMITMSSPSAHSGQVGPIVEVGSSIPPQLPPQTNHDQAPSATSPAEVTRVLADSIVSTPTISKFRNVVQETPSTQRHFNGLAAVPTLETSQLPEYETQMKDEDESQYPGGLGGMPYQSSPNARDSTTTIRETDVHNVVDSFHAPAISASMRQNPENLIDVAPFVPSASPAQLDAPIPTSPLDAHISPDNITTASSSPPVESASEEIHPSVVEEAAKTASTDTNLPATSTSGTESESEHELDKNTENPGETSKVEAPASESQEVAPPVAGSASESNSSDSDAIRRQLFPIAPSEREPTLSTAGEENAIVESPPAARHVVSKKRKLQGYGRSKQGARKKTKLSNTSIEDSTDESDAVVSKHPTSTIVVSIPSKQTPTALATKTMPRSQQNPGTTLVTPVPARLPSTTPSSSADSVASRTRRSAGRGGAGKTSAGKSSGSPKPFYKSPRVAFSNSKIQEMQSSLKFLRAHGGRVIEKLGGGFDILVIGNGEVKKTTKLLAAVALGKPITTESWITASARAEAFLEPADFVPSDPVRQKAWGFTFNDGKDRRDLFQDKRVFLTKSVKDEYGNAYREIADLLKKTGAKEVVSKGAKNLKIDISTIAITAEADDIDALDLLNRDVVCYNKDFLSTSILRGTMDLNSDEFRVKAPASLSPPRKKGRPRKSA